MTGQSVFTERAALLAGALPARLTCRVRQVVGLVIEATALAVPVGASCRVRTRSGPVGAEVSINVKLPAGTTLAAAARQLSALGIEVG